MASRYASFVHFMCAEVAAWDPYASEPCFHRSGARKEYDLNELVKDADIFAPMVPLTEQTRGLVTAEHIRALLCIPRIMRDVRRMPTSNGLQI
ncbi:NAD(P)-dependent oxidoreductase [Paenibacillus dakarensis]|uniref:NAD(P)-dependent oxidoreductase n=1 Tax=Paenibacillus dakarensis TaxID=1527293 RepID=UPI0035220374